MVTLKQESDAYPTLQNRFFAKFRKGSYKMFLRKIRRPYQLGTTPPMAAFF